MAFEGGGGPHKARVNGLEVFLEVKFTALPESGDQMVLMCKPEHVASRFEANPQSPHSLSSQGLKAMGFLACISNHHSCLQLAAPDCATTSA